MLQKYHILKTSIFIVFLSFFTFSCAKETKKNEDIIPEKEWLPNTDARVKRAYEEGKGLLGKDGILGGDKNTGGSIKFANTNLMWKATLKTLENIPLLNVDYAGGIIITDWYGNSNSLENKEEIKITVKFVSDEIKSSSIEVITHKKICFKGDCSTKLNVGALNDKIKEKIVVQARAISIEEAKKKN
jgi:hypothetical protein